MERGAGKSQEATQVTLLKVHIPGLPQAKERPRFNSKTKRAYTPRDTQGWEAGAGQVLAFAWGAREPINEAVGVKVIAVWPRPQTRPQVVSRRAWKGEGRIWKPTRPDGDNVLKAALDAVQHSKALVDDGRVARAWVDTYYAALGEEPGVIIILYELEEYMIEHHEPEGASEKKPDQYDVRLRDSGVWSVLVQDDPEKDGWSVMVAVERYQDAKHLLSLARREGMFGWDVKRIRVPTAVAAQWSEVEPWTAPEDV